MLKRPFVSLFHSLKSKKYRYYWTHPKKEDIDALSLIKEKYDIPKEVFEHMKTQEKYLHTINQDLHTINQDLHTINQELTNLQTKQKTEFQNIHNNIHKNSCATDDILVISFTNMILTSYILFL